MLIICFKKNQPQHCHHNDDSHHHHDGGGDGGRSSAHTLSGVFLLECHWPAVGMEPGQLFYSYSLHTPTPPLLFQYYSLHHHYYSTTMRHQQNYSRLVTHTNTTIPLQPPSLLVSTPPLFHKGDNTSTQCSVHNSALPSLYIAFPSYLLERMLVRITRRTLLQRHKH